jgi:hypothetical protein
MILVFSSGDRSTCLGKIASRAGFGNTPMNGVSMSRRGVSKRWNEQCQPERRGLARGSQDARRVLKALNLVDQRPPAPPKGQETMM